MNTSFIATLGLERQVVTVTLDLLLAQGIRFAEVIVIHTDRANRADNAAMRDSVDDTERELQRYVAAKQIGGYQFIELRRTDGTPMSDIHTEADAGEVFNAIFRAVRQQKRDHRRPVHLNVAGGRKGMTAYGMATAQLLFEEGDHLWLLVSSPEFLRSRQLHAQAPDDAWLLEIPVLRYSALPTTVTALLNYDNPAQAIYQQDRFVNRQSQFAKASFFHALPDEQKRLVEAKVKLNKTNKELAASLSKSEKTIGNQFTAIYARLTQSGLLPEGAIANHETLVKLLADFFAPDA